MYYSTNYDSPIGLLTMACNQKNMLVGLWFGKQRYYDKENQIEFIAKDDINIFNQTKKWLDKYFAGLNPNIFELPLAPIGSDFRQQVWKILKQIPYGTVITYGDIANKITQRRNKKNMSAQAVGGAVANNPISIIIPCHRVIGAKNNLTGFSGGIDKKIQLLEHEGIDTSTFIYPVI